MAANEWTEHGKPIPWPDADPPVELSAAERIAEHTGHTEFVGEVRMPTAYVLALHHGAESLKRIARQLDGGPSFSADRICQVAEMLDSLAQQANTVDITETRAHKDRLDI